ncbi:hypothetical protein KP509_06G053200 [Ceratopteris richardii]|uniref:Uncharacterized protein n=1 Tax=Ceratopteris richardii TaxID=49495 RepID=A0A8T2UN01_CERRI|nr:hypothetical protein KP509_06G053200 [Ceratopteris richardii]
MQPLHSLAVQDVLHRHSPSTRHGVSEPPCTNVPSYVEQEYPAIDAALEVVEDTARFILRELYVSFRFVRYDLTVTVLPGALLTLATHMKSTSVFGATASLTPMWRSLPSSIIWMWLFVYVSNLANQIHGAEEDAINKPSRPIPFACHHLIRPQALCVDSCCFCTGGIMPG